MKEGNEKKMTETKDQLPAEKEEQQQQDITTFPVREPTPAPESIPIDPPIGLKQEKKEKQKPKPPANAGGLSGKALKELKKKEKADKRAQAKAAAGKPAVSESTGGQQQNQGGKRSQQKKGGQKGPVQTICINDDKQAESGAVKVIEKIVEVPAPEKGHGLVGLLKELEAEQVEKRKAPVFGIEIAHPDVHPAILTLGTQINKRVIGGATARCVGFLLAIKRVSPPCSFHIQILVLIH